MSQRNEDLVRLIEKYHRDIQRGLFTVKLCLLGKKGQERDEIIEKFSDSLARNLCDRHQRADLKHTLKNSIKQGLLTSNEDDFIKLIKDFLSKVYRDSQ